ncbi:MAG TPA: multiheme c-type cytochrome [Terriglobia bacterium]|nr:multiheme c-type cytochrome [Terriglobia bacterium]
MASFYIFRKFWSKGFGILAGTVTFHSFRMRNSYLKVAFHESLSSTHARLNSNREIRPAGQRVAQPRVGVCFEAPASFDGRQAIFKCSCRLALMLVITSSLFSAALVAQRPQSAEYCGNCHRSIEQGWNQSVHSQAMESRLFQDALQMANSDLGPHGRTVCLGCHAPTVGATGDLKLELKVTWEGITCDYCHSIRSVNMSAVNPRATVVYDNVKQGPWKGITSPAHGTAYSLVHTSSALCATCHQYKNSLGFPVLTTYSEWQKGSYAAENKGCQSCHMYRVEGDVVDPRVKRTPNAGINLHEMPGSHSLTQLNKAIRGNLLVSHDGGQLRVEVDVTNQGAGHMVPTGSPLRKLILEVTAFPFGAKPQHQRRVFTRVVADEQGKELNREDLVFIRAAKVVSDTRLAPGETKKESFTFNVPQGVRSTVEADFYYFYSPSAATRAQQEVKFLSFSRFEQ